MYKVQLKFIFGKPTRFSHDPIPTEQLTDAKHEGYLNLLKYSAF